MLYCATDLWCFSSLLGCIWGDAVGGEVGTRGGRCDAARCKCCCEAEAP